MLAAVMLATTKIWQCFLLAAALSLAAPACSPGGPELLIQGDQLLQAGKAAEAVVVLERAATRLPTESRAWNHLGLGYHAGGRITEARKAYTRALELNRNLVVTHFNLGVLEFEQRNWQPAESEMRTFLQWNPSSGEAWSKLGQAQFHSGQPDTAERSLLNAVRLQPQDADAWNILGLAQVQRRQFREAYKSFTAAQKASPGHPASLLNLGVTAQQQLGDRRAALQHYLAYLELNPAPANSAAVRELVAPLERQLGMAPRVVPPVRSVASATNSPTPLLRPSSPARPLTVTNRAPVGPLTARVPPVPLSGSNRWSGPPPIEPGSRLTAPEITPPRALAVTRPTPVPVVGERPQETNPPVASPAVASPVPPALVLAPVTPKPVVVEKEIVPRPSREPILRPGPTNSPPGNVLPVAVATPAVPVMPVAQAPDERQAPEVLSSPSVDPSTTVFSEIGDPPSTKKTVWQRMNPVRWFRKDEPEAMAEPSSAEKQRLALLNPARWFKNPQKTPTPLDPVSPAAPEPVAREAIPVPEASEPKVTEAAPVPSPAPEARPASPPKPVFARYTRQLSARPAPGDRRAAEEQFVLGVAAHERRDLPTAVARYQRATQADPSYYDAHYNLGVAALALGDLPLSLLAGEYAVATAERPEQARWNLAVALQRAKFPVDAAEELDRLMASSPGDVRAELMLASICARELGEVPRARQHYENVLARSPSHPERASIQTWLRQNPGL